MNTLITIAVMSLRLPDAGTFEDCHWQPHFTDPADLQIRDSTLAILTHSSRHFDPLGQTQPAVNRIVATMKSADRPVIYLHDKYNQKNPAWMYLYDDRRPTAIVASDVGHIDLDLSAVRHVVFAGGYFGQCEQSTVSDVIRYWRRDAQEQDLRATQVVDGIFCVGEHVGSEDAYSKRVRSYFYDKLRKQHPKAVISVDQILSMIEKPDSAVTLLCRQVPPVPADVNIMVDYFGHVETVQFVDADAPMLTLAYRRSDDFLNFPKLKPDSEKLKKRRLARMSGSFSRTRIRSVVP